MATKATFVGSVRCVRIRSLPGDTVLRLLCDTVSLPTREDPDGRSWPAGTEFRPLSRGYDEAVGAICREVTIREPDVDK